MTSISEFYADRCVFLTGATGFVGKVLLEKLLRSCPKIRLIYILVRPKRGAEVQARLDVLLQSKIFDKVRESQPSFGSKVVPVTGDILEPGLGISTEDVRRIATDVTIVFHSAATVKFDDPLKWSVQMNVVSVQRVLDLCHQCDRIEALVHISTAYANCDRNVINETVYPSPMCPQKLINAMEWMDVELVDVLKSKVIGNRPNTYTFTKAVAESLLVAQRKKLACAIVRPSIVGASWREPVEGWVDNFSGPTGILAAIGKGLARMMMGDANAIADIVPVDIVANLIIAAGWCTAVEQRFPKLSTTDYSRLIRLDTVQVYNCTTGQSNKVTWGQLERASKDVFDSFPLDSPVRLPHPALTLSRFYRSLCVWFDHILPAWFMDLGLKLSGKKAVLLKLNSRLLQSLFSLEYFTTREWIFTTEHATELFEKMSAEDQEEFNFDVKRICWNTYLHNYCMGVKIYALNESMHDLPAARKAIRRLKLRHVVKQCIMAITGWLLLSRLVSAKRLLYTCLSLFVRAYSRIQKIIEGVTIEAVTK